MKRLLLLVVMVALVLAMAPAAMTAPKETRTVCQDGVTKEIPARAKAKGATEGPCEEEPPVSLECPRLVNMGQTIADLDQSGTLTAGDQITSGFEAQWTIGEEWQIVLGTLGNPGTQVTLTPENAQLVATENNLLQITITGELESTLPLSGLVVADSIGIGCE